MLLQKILFPNIESCFEQSMFFRCADAAAYISATRKEIIVNPFRQIHATTYFNSFPIAQWKRYTVVDKIFLDLQIQGRFVLRLLHIYNINNVPNIQVVAVYEDDYKELKKKRFEYPEVAEEGVLSFALEAISQPIMFAGGEYCSDMAGDQLADIKIAIGMCTFRRESYVCNNIKMLEERILNNENSVLYNNLDIYISDNGQTLGNTFDNPFVRVFPNENAGGAGGFTRTFIEILKNRENGYTHILVMDDDIKLSPDTLERTYCFLKMLKETYRNIILGSSFLNLDKPNMQVEIGGNIIGGYPYARGCDEDLSDLRIVLQNAAIQKLSYLGWWHCAIPITFVQESFPLPLFIKRDDVEFCLRCKTEKVVINGICVWHEPYLKKFNFTTQYYSARNNLIMNAVRGNFSFNSLKVEIKENIKKMLLTYRYGEAELYLKGVTDFLKGIDWLKTTNPVTLHRELREGMPQIKKVEDLGYEFGWAEYVGNTRYEEKKLKKWIRRLTLNGAFFKARGTVVVPIVGAYIGTFWRVDRAVFYNSLAYSGYLSKRDNKRAVRILKDANKIIKQAQYGYDSTVKEYRDRSGEVTNADFWMRYLKLQGESNRGKPE